MYRTIKLKNGKGYSVPDQVADEYEAILNAKPDMEEDPEKKLEGENGDEETKNDNIEEKHKKAQEKIWEKIYALSKETHDKKKDSDAYLKTEKSGEKGKEQKKKAAEVGDMEEEDKKKKDMEEEEYLKKDMKKKDMEHEEEGKKDEDMEEEEGEKAFLNKKKKDMKKMNSLEAENEKLKGEKAALQAKLNSKVEAGKEKEAIKQRVKVINSAAELLKENPDNLVEMADIDIKTKVVNSVFPEIATDGQTEEFISGMFEVAKHDKAESYTKLMDAGLSSNDNYLKSEEGKGKIDDEAEMKKKYMEGRKNAYQKPISGNQGDYSKSTSQSGY